MSKELLFKQIALQTCATEYFDFADEYLMNEAGVYIRAKFQNKYTDNRQGNAKRDKDIKNELKILEQQKNIYRKTNIKYVRQFDGWEGQSTVNDLVNQLHDFIEKL
jgi:hypothetical protein